MEEFDKNDPYIWSSQGKKRKNELISEFISFCPGIKSHVLSCPAMRETNFEICDICNKFCALINILAQCENKRNCGKLNVKKMVEKGIIEHMIYGDGIQFH